MKRLMSDATFAAADEARQKRGNVSATEVLKTVADCQVQLVLVSSDGAPDQTLFVQKTNKPEEIGARTIFGRSTRDGSNRRHPFHCIVFKSMEDRNAAGFGHPSFDMYCLINEARVLKAHSKR